MSQHDDQEFDQPIPLSPDHVTTNFFRAIQNVSSRIQASHWHPISTVPFNQDVELRVVDNGESITLPFPCRRTNTDTWINVDLGSTVAIEPVDWRVWQHDQSPQSHHSPLDLNDREALIHTHGAIRRASD